MNLSAAPPASCVILYDAIMGQRPAGVGQGRGRGKEEEDGKED